MVGVAAAELDRTLDRASAVGGDDEDIGAARLVVEGAVGDQQSRGRIAERELDLEGLAALQLGGLLADKVEIDLEGAVADLRIDFRDLGAIGLAAGLDRSDLAGLDPAELAFVDARDQLVSAGAAQL